MHDFYLLVSVQRTKTTSIYANKSKDQEHLVLEAMNCRGGCNQPLPQGVEGVDMCDACNRGLEFIEPSIITSDHAQKRAPEFMSLQFQFRVKTKH